MTKKQLRVELEKLKVSLYTIRKDKAGGYNITYANYLSNNCISEVKKGFVMADDYKGVLESFC